MSDPYNPFEEKLLYTRRSLELAGHVDQPGGARPPSQPVQRGQLIAPREQRRPALGKPLSQV